MRNKIKFKFNEHLIDTVESKSSTV